MTDDVIYDVITNKRQTKMAIRLILTLLTLQKVLGINIINDYYMKSGTGGECGNNINVADDLYLRSHIGSFQLGSLIPYSNNEDCTVTLDAGTGRKLLLQFIKFDLQPKVGGACVDKLTISDEAGDTSTVALTTSATAAGSTATQATTSTDTNVTSSIDVSNTTEASTAAQASTVTQASTATQASSATITSTDSNSTVSNSTATEASTGSGVTTGGASPQTTSSTQILCGDSASPYESNGRNLTLKFETDGSVTANGFKILVTSFEESNTCSTGQFHCDTNRCIPSKLKCDTVFHCLDQSDESKEKASCTLLDDIIGLFTGLGTNLLIVIIVVAGVVVFVPIASVIIYQLCCKKTQTAPAQEVEAPTSSKSPKKLPKNVVAVEPADPPKKEKPEVKVKSKGTGKVK